MQHQLPTLILHPSINIIQARQCLHPGHKAVAFGKKMGLKNMDFCRTNTEMFRKKWTPTHFTPGFHILGFYQPSFCQHQVYFLRAENNILQEFHGVLLTLRHHKKNKKRKTSEAIQNKPTGEAGNNQRLIQTSKI